MFLNRPNQALAAHDAYEALLNLQHIVEDAVKATHDAELEAFHLATTNGESDMVRLVLQGVEAQMSGFEARLLQAREKLALAAST